MFVSIIVFLHCQLSFYLLNIIRLTINISYCIITFKETCAFIKVFYVYSICWWRHISRATFIRFYWYWQVWCSAASFSTAMTSGRTSGHQFVIIINDWSISSTRTITAIINTIISSPMPQKYYHHQHHHNHHHHHHCHQNIIIIITITSHQI